jgi:hypothetical protein
MKIIFFFAAILLAIGLKARPLDQVSVSVDANWLEGPRTIIVGSGPESGQVKPGSRTLLVYVVNKTDATLRIPTESLMPGREDQSDCVLVTLAWEGPVFSDKRKIIIPETNISIVEIRKGETACIRKKIPDEWPLINKPIRLRMKIPSDIWNRYKLDFFSFDVDVQE